MSTAQAKHLSIAVVGDEELVSGLRLAGISRYYVINEEHNAREDVRKALGELIDEAGVGVIVILEDYVEYVKDLLTRLRKGKRVIPVIIDVPSKLGTQCKDVVGYYKAFIRKSIGFDVEI